MGSVASLQKDMRILNSLMQRKKDIHVKRIGNSLQIGDLTYIPSPTGDSFHSDTTSLVKAIKGPYGSGKSVTACLEAVIQAISMPKCKDGVRRSRGVVVRNTYGELETTTIKTWMDWLDELGHTRLYTKSPIRFIAKFSDKDGPVEMEVLFMALDKPKDLKKLKSLEVTWGLVEEANEVAEEVVTHLIGRRGRYPKREDLVDPNYVSQVCLVTNAPDTDHWFYGKFEVQKPKGFTLYSQPPGLLKSDNDEWYENPHADNIQHLRDGYYTEMAQGSSADFIKVFCCGEYGIVSTGKPVYNEYNDDMHSSDKINYNPDLPVDLCFDFGLTPCCAVIQVIPGGHINVIAEYTSIHSGLTQFVQNVVKPAMGIAFPGYKIGFAVGDPAGKAGADTDARSCLQILIENGIPAVGAFSNVYMKRVEPVKAALSTLVEGRPQLMISRGCTVLRKGFLGSYQLERIAGEMREDYKDRPKKNFYSHIQDALQYGVMTILRDLDTPTSSNIGMRRSA